MRDLLIGAPVFWVHENVTLLICFAAALAAWLAPSGLWKGRALLWSDAAGLAAFSAFGAAKGLAFGLAPLPAFAMGVVTGCVGGIIRDLLAGEDSILLRSELYVTAAALSAALLVGLVLAGMPGGFAGLSRRLPALPCGVSPSGGAGRCPATGADRSRRARRAGAPRVRPPSPPAGAATDRRCAIRQA